MARMQRRKPADQKKKKKQDAGDSAPGDLNSDRTGPSLVHDNKAAPGETKKKNKPVLSASRRTSGEQTALMRLLDRYFGNWIQFLREVKVELSKVAWPARKETIATTAVVLVFVFIVALFLGVVDIALSSLVRMIL